MQKITLFMMAGCPHCKRAIAAQQRLMEADARYAALSIEMIDETLQPDLAAQYDYYYVPTYYVGDKKVHEGSASEEQVKTVLDAALEQ